MLIGLRAAITHHQPKFVKYGSGKCQSSHQVALVSQSWPRREAPDVLLGKGGAIRRLWQAFLQARHCLVLCADCAGRAEEVW